MERFITCSGLAQGMGEEEIPNELPGVNPEFPREADPNMVAFNHYWSTFAQDQIFHHDNRKYQFVYLAGASIVTAILILVQATVEGFTAGRWTILALAVVGMTASIVAAVMLQLYTRNRNDFRMSLIHANYRYLTGAIDAPKWEKATREAYAAFVKQHNATRKDHPWLYKVLDMLT